MPIDDFLARWRNAGGSERANYQLFVADLCALLGVGAPDPASDDTRDNAYVFERRVSFAHGDGSTSARAFASQAKRSSFMKPILMMSGLSGTGIAPGAIAEAKTNNNSITI